MIRLISLFIWFWYILHVSCSLMCVAMCAAWRRSCMLETIQFTLAWLPVFTFYYKLLKLPITSSFVNRKSICDNVWSPNKQKKQQQQQQQKLSSLLSPVMNASIVCFETRLPLAADGLVAWKGGWCEGRKCTSRCFSNVLSREQWSIKIPSCGFGFWSDRNLSG